MYGTVRDVGARAKLTPKKKERFVKRLGEVGVVLRACEAAGISRQTAYDWRRDDDEFAASWDRALEDHLDTIEEALYERAVKGLDEPVYQGGQLVGHKRNYSDTAAIFMLKGGRPEKFRERYEHSGPKGGPISISGLTVEVVQSRPHESK